MTIPTPAVHVEPAKTTPLPNGTAPAPSEPQGEGATWAGKARSVVLSLFILAALVLLLAWALGLVQLPALGATKSGPEKAEAEAAPLGVTLVKDVPHTLAVPEDVRAALGIRKGNRDIVAVAQAPTKTRPLVMPGSTALDPTRLVRIRARFPAEVVEIGKVREDLTRSKSGMTEYRELRSGDRVQKGDLLGVFYSVDVGSKKNDLIDALVQLKLDEEILDRAEKASHAVPEVFLLNARRNVEGDRNSIARALNTLKTWNIPADDIKAVYDEAEQISKRKGKRDAGKESLWARVELRAPDEGVVIERNVALHEMVVDNTTNLFQIAKVDRLAVLANVPEDDLPALEALTPEQRRWTVRTVGAPPVLGYIDDIGYLIDPNQHTAVVKGHIDNPGERLRGGQFITATVELPPPAGVVEVPMDAVVEDGQQSIVFVQSDPVKHHYTMRRVELTHRFEKTAFVRATPIPKEKQLTREEKELGLLPKVPLRPGERVLVRGAVELKAALLDRESASVKDAEGDKDR
jgi:cobalt-zinc-cadmium efflux system membrane fusion protein